jgi:hypothetical protein
LSIRLAKRFAHPDGRRILADDCGVDGWIVEVRPANEREPRKRWLPKTEREAADTVFWLMGDDSTWFEE